MNSVIASRIKKAVPSALIILLLFVFSALAFLPVFRAAPVPSVASESLDNDAMRAINNAAAYVESNDFITELHGVIKARVFGIPYSQKVSGGRSVRGDEYTDVAESMSAFVKAAIKKEARGGAYFVTHGDRDGKSFSYGEPTELSRSDFVAAYGLPVTGLCKYRLDGAIVGAECAGENIYKYTLDVDRATEYCRNEIKTALGGKSYPEYESIELTLYTDGERPVRLDITEKFRVDKFGGTRCSAEYSETFVYADTPMPYQGE